MKHLWMILKRPLSYFLIESKATNYRVYGIRASIDIMLECDKIMKLKQHYLGVFFLSVMELQKTYNI